MIPLVILYSNIKTLPSTHLRDHDHIFGTGIKSAYQKNVECSFVAVDYFIIAVDIVNDAGD